jgi:CheY-like chemotaxis protein
MLYNIPQASVRTYPPSPKRTILVIDDDPSIRDALDDVLSNEGYDVVCARDGIEGMARLHGSAKPDAILLDVTMPGMDGWDFVGEVRKTAAMSKVPIIIYSALDSRAYPHPPHTLVLRKPIDLDVLLATLDRACTSGLANHG